MKILKQKIKSFFLILLLCNLSQVAYAGLRDKMRDVNIRLNIDKADIKKDLDSFVDNYLKSSQEESKEFDIDFFHHELKTILQKKLKSLGYFDSRVYNDYFSKEKKKIRYKIIVGTEYKLNNIEIKLKENSNNDVRIPDLNDLSIRQRGAAKAEDVYKAIYEIEKFIEENNCLLGFEVTHQAIIDKLHNTLDVVFIINALKAAKIGDVSFTGLNLTKEEYAKKLVQLHEGRCFKRSFVANANNRLQQSELFITSIPSVVEKPSGIANLEFDLKERKAKSVKAGINFSTDLGIGGNLGWEHRNLFGSGEKIEAIAGGNKKEQEYSLEYTKPFFIVDSQKLRLNGTYVNKATEAYKSRGIKTEAEIERKISKSWYAGAGVGVNDLKLQALGKKQNITLFSFPFFIKCDKKDDNLDPKSGHEFRVDQIVFFNGKFDKKTFYKTRFEASKYFSFDKNQKGVLAARIGYGIIYGIKYDMVPINERFFLGGGNSLRGYAYQKAGELNSEGKPKGGNSFVNSSLEYRFRINEDFGLVAFYDSGLAFDTSKSSKKKLLQSTGLGLRYLTSFGPIRFDVAVPIKKRGKFDKSYQLYFGIGQSF